MYTVGTGPTNPSTSIPNPTTVVVTYDNNQGCRNSVIPITKGAGTWTLGTGLSFVNNLTAASTNFTTSSSPAEVFATTSGNYDLNANGGNYAGFVRIINNTRPIPTVTLSNTTICVGGSIAGAFSEPAWSQTNVDLDWKIYQGTTTAAPLFATSNAANPTFGPFNVSGTYLLKFQVREQCCGWSTPIYRTITVNLDPSPPTDIPFSSPFPLAEICVPGTIVTTSGVSGASGGVPPFVNEWDYQNGAHAFGSPTTTPPVFASTLGANVVAVRIQANPSKGCDASTFYTETITGNPVPVGNASPAITSVCNATPFSISLSTSNGVTGTTFAITSQTANPNLTGSATLTGSTISGTFTNTSGTPQSKTITILPSGPSPTNCAGTPFTTTITVYPALSATASSNTPVCPNTTLNLNANGIGGGGSFTYAWSGPALFSSGSQNPTIPNATAANSGTYTVVVTDLNGCSATATTTVSVSDNVPPTISCPGNIVANTSATTCTAIVTYATPLGQDNCPGAVTNQTNGLASGSAFPIGTTVNTFTVTNNGSAAVSCTFAVTVLDNTPPTINCPGSISVHNDLGNCSAIA